MKLNLSIIAAAVAGACASAASIAAPLDPVGTSPEVTYYIAGASAQAAAFNAVAKEMFTTPDDVIKITAVAPCGDPADELKHVAYYGMRAGKRTLIVYRNKDGSGAGVQQLLANATSAAAITSGGVVISLPATAAAAGGAGAWTTTSGTCTATLPVAALSDVRHTELDSTVLAVAGTTGYDALSAIKTPILTAVQGFGVAVSWPLYKDMQDKQIADGKLAATCDDSDADRLTAECQPNLNKTTYTSLSAKSGAIKDLGGFLGKPEIDWYADPELTLARRVALSGTQATSQIYFLNAKMAGALDPVRATDFPVADIATNLFAVEELSSSSTLKGSSYLGSTTKRVVGVLSLENVPTNTADTWKWVRINGVSPNYSYDVTTTSIVLDPYQRQQFAKGDYDFAVDSYVLYKDSALNASGGIVKDLSDTMKLTSKSNLLGFGYVDVAGSWKPWTSADGYTGNVNKQTKVRHYGNNLQPLY